MTAAIVILAYIVVVYMDTFSIYKQRNRKDFYVNASLCLLSFVTAFLLAINIDLPSPSPFIVHIVEGLFKMKH